MPEPNTHEAHYDINAEVRKIFYQKKTKTSNSKIFAPNEINY